MTGLQLFNDGEGYENVCLRVYTYPFLFESGYFFLRFCLLSTCIRWKQSPKMDLFKKRSPEWRFLKTPAFHLRVDGRKRRFSNTMMSCTSSMTHAPWGMLSYLHRCSVFVRTGEKDSNTLRKDAYFFLNVEKTLRFQKYPDTCGRGLNVTYWRCFKLTYSIFFQVVKCSQFFLEWNSI